MSKHAFREISVSIADERRDALLSALRRGAEGEALELLDGWRPMFDDDLECEAEWSDLTYVERKQIELSEWTRDECRLHVEGGRFQHALALLDRYLILPPVFTRADDRARLEKMQS